VEREDVDMAKNNDYQRLSKDTTLLINGQEGREVDFKVKANGVNTEDFVAFANGQGGTILIGVEEKKGPKGEQAGLLVGCPIDDKTKQGLISKAASCRPSIDIEIRFENVKTKKPIIRIDIPKGDEKPYCTSSGMYKMRADGQNIAIDPPLMKSIIMEKESEEFLARFRAAGDDLLKQMRILQEELSTQIMDVESLAQAAADAAEESLWANS